MSYGGAGSGHCGDDDIHHKKELPFLSAWMAHWSGAACCGSSVNDPKLSLRYEGDESEEDNSKASKTKLARKRNAKGEVKNDKQGNNGFGEVRENLMLALAPTEMGNSDSKLGKQIDVCRDKEKIRVSSPPNFPILDFSIGSPFQSFMGGGEDADEELQRLPSHPCMNLFPMDSSAEKNRFRGFFGWPNGVPRMPSSSPHDVETMRIFTTIDTIAGSSRGAPTFSQTTRHFMFTKTDLNVTKGESSMASEFNGKALREFLTLSTKTLVTPECNKKELIDAICDTGNESSPETEVMEMNSRSGRESSPFKEDGKEKSKLPISLFLATPFRAEAAELPDINEEIPAIPGETDVLEDDDASTSRTESLDAEHLVSPADITTNSKSDFIMDPETKTDYSNRWVKRLKPSSSLAFAYGTKSSAMDEAPYRPKGHMLFSKVLRCSEPVISKPSEQERGKTNQIAALPKKESNEITMSHAWIQRWCHRPHGMKEKQQENHVGERAQSSAAVVEKHPSIAAMALMGKAMNGFRQCETRRKGAVMIWNSEDDEIR